MRRVLARFPKTDFAFAYGSAAFGQGAKSDASFRMLDLILVSRDVSKWHAENIVLNPRDYSRAARRTTTLVARASRGHVFFNPGVHTKEHGIIKYGVTSYQNLIEDCTTWNSFYIAGRLTKPVRILIEDEDASEAIRVNRINALSLVIDDEQHVLNADTYIKLAGLSYDGDVRVGVAESPSKTRDLVVNSLGDWENAYSPLVGLLVNASPPKTKEQLRSIVRCSSIKQAVLGLYSSKISTAISYVSRKLSKRLKG